MMPINIVIIQPCGSLPGRIALANAPAINPNIIHDKAPMIYILE
jgi:hypothetical protein